MNLLELKKVVKYYFESYFKVYTFFYLVLLLLLLGGYSLQNTLIDLNKEWLYYGRFGIYTLLLTFLFFVHAWVLGIFFSENRVGSLSAFLPLSHVAKNIFISLLLSIPPIITYIFNRDLHDFLLLRQGESFFVYYFCIPFLCFFVVATYWKEGNRFLILLLLTAFLFLNVFLLRDFYRLTPGLVVNLFWIGLVLLFFSMVKNSNKPYLHLCFLVFSILLLVIKATGYSNSKMSYSNLLVKSHFFGVKTQEEELLSFLSNPMNWSKHTNNKDYEMYFYGNVGALSRKLLEGHEKDFIESIMSYGTENFAHFNSYFMHNQTIIPKYFPDKEMQQYIWKHWDSNDPILCRMVYTHREMIVSLTRTLMDPCKDEDFEDVLSTYLGDLDSEYDRKFEQLLKDEGEGQKQIKKLMFSRIRSIDKNYRLADVNSDKLIKDYKDIYLKTWAKVVKPFLAGPAPRSSELMNRLVKKGEEVGIDNETMSSQLYALSNSVEDTFDNGCQKFGNVNALACIKQSVQSLLGENEHVPEIFTEKRWEKLLRLTGTRLFLDIQ